MTNEQTEMKERLTEELGELYFAGAEKVFMKAARQPDWKQRLRAWWNQEIEIPLIPVAAVCFLLICALLLTRGEKSPKEQLFVHETRRLIEVGGNTYWIDDYERAVTSIADSR
ncbi:hypothetical protein [Paenibacillus methanolicus]|uniref:Uncharacterized protein n=1 Tax=Paenibacillus methanolicus TaxID=582686 RepID=A0A5S5C5J1_9BACL|nr:hypothetical protein [Paenibacillus methanolicus]TYP74597.1 hypothetical protein BCM02_105141 [Paenibacillus methanolicus]